MTLMATVHTAAPPLGTTQVCAACGEVLQDNIALLEGRVAVYIGTGDAPPDLEPHWWAVGERVAKVDTDHCRLSYPINPPSRALDTDEWSCSGAN